MKRGETYTGNPCKRCQETVRYQSTGACVRCQREHALKQKQLKKALP